MATENFDEETCQVRKTAACAIVSATGEVRWLAIMKQFNAKQKEKCSSFETNTHDQQISKSYISGAKYEGACNIFGFHGYGTYTFPNGAVYEGDFKNGTFDGYGELRYPDTATLISKFKDGKMDRNDVKVIFNDGLEYEQKNWNYCRMPDRRFAEEYFNMMPGGLEMMTHEIPSLDIPSGMCDSGTGFVDLETKIEIHYDGEKTHRCTTPAEVEWMKKKYRIEPMGPVGPVPELYEKWIQPELTTPDMPPPAAMTTARDTSLSIYDRESSGVELTKLYNPTDWRVSTFSGYHESVKPFQTRLPRLSTVRRKIS